jgi:hypothetical protein
MVTSVCTSWFIVTIVTHIKDILANRTSKTDTLLRGFQILKQTYIWSYSRFHYPDRHPVTQVTAYRRTFWESKNVICHEGYRSAGNPLLSSEPVSVFALFVTFWRSIQHLEICSLADRLLCNVSVSCRRSRTCIHVFLLTYLQLGCVIQTRQCLQMISIPLDK